MYNYFCNNKSLSLRIDPYIEFPEEIAWSALYENKLIGLMYLPLSE